jgi:hypothetical protein
LVQSPELALEIYRVSPGFIADHEMFAKLFQAIDHTAPMPDLKQRYRRTISPPLRDDSDAEHETDERPHMHSIFLWSCKSGCYIKVAAI